MAAPPTKLSRRAIPWISRSISLAIIRDPRPAVSNASTTASGVTIPVSVTVPSSSSRRVPRVDIDRFLAANQPAWDRLAVLCDRAEHGVRRLQASELDELVRLYQRASAHLSHARTY